MLSIKSYGWKIKKIIIEINILINYRFSNDYIVKVINYNKIRGSVHTWMKSL